MPQRRKTQSGWSATQVVVGLTIVVCVLTWMVSASAYATAQHQARVVAADDEGEEAAGPYIPRPRLRRSSGLVFGAVMIGTFLKNAVVEIPHGPQVIWFALTQRVLIPIGFVLTEGFVIALGVALSVAERSLESPKTKRRSKVAEIRIPKPTDD